MSNFQIENIPWAERKGLHPVCEIKHCHSSGLFIAIGSYIMKLQNALLHRI